VELVVGPAGQAEQIRQSSAYSVSFSAEDWKGEGGQYRLRHDALLPPEVWRPWWPVRICISGHVRKVSEGGICPVPYVKVEVFDVDREACWWPYLRNWWEVLLDRPVVRIPDLLKEPPFPPEPIPGPDPAPELKLGRPGGLSTSPLAKVALNPQPLPPRSGVEGVAARFSKVALNPQPLPPRSAVEGVAGRFQGSQINPQPEPPGSLAAQAFTRVGEARLLEGSIAAGLDRLTLTSKVAPWHIFPWCFYSTAEVCETTTDCNGYFNCCFSWFPLHFRRGRLRFDSRPDIIIKVTQIINGVTTVIYMDPYTSTRWNVTTAHIDLFLDDEEVVCGSGVCYQPPAGAPVFLTRIGDDEVYQINQATGLYNDGSLSNVPYGGLLYVYGQFGDALTRSDPGKGDPPPYYYYRLSYAKPGSSDDDFKFIDIDLNDARVDKGTLMGQSHKLGPYTVNNVHSLYEVRNFEDYYWYNPDWIGTWYSWIAEPDTSQYILRLEMFDKNGAKLTTASGVVDYRNGAGAGTGSPPAPLPPMTDHCDLLLTLDNVPPKAELTIPAVTNECGVIPWSPGLVLNLLVNASQANGRLRSWELYYTKGVGVEQPLAGHVSANGLPGSFTNHVVSGAPLLAGLTSTCAFALRLRAVAHIRDGRQFVYDDQDIDAIAIEKCS
jgi:hypothetical protein